jgi:2-dehydro-3-deoxyphosphogluconate aldolase / (4S)-4-hydroxy-2-oxoglutarate aldolase
MSDAIDRMLHRGPVVPVVVIDEATHAVPLARALLAGGIGVIEVTLRSDAALDSLARIARDVPEMILAAGTVTTAAQLRSVRDAGAVAAISPGLTDALLAASHDLAMPLLPGIATASELMRGLDAGLSRFKLFPASAVGGVALLQAFAGPFAHARFCPTGGIGIDQAPDYLALPNVVCVGASWVASRADVAAQRWDPIAANAARAAALAPALAR